MKAIVNNKNLIKSQRIISRNRHITDYIGNTPLIELKNISSSITPVKIYAKAEWFNPRDGQRMDAESESGNTYHTPDKQDWVLLFH